MKVLQYLILVVLQNVIYCNPSCLVTQSQEFFLVYQISPAQQLIYTHFKLSPKGFSKHCFKKNSETKVNCLINQPQDRVSNIQLKGFNKTGNSYENIGFSYFWNYHYSRSCDCSKASSLNFHMKVLHSRTSNRFLSYEVKVNTSSSKHLTPIESKFYRCNTTQGNVSDNCVESTTGNFEMFNFCQTGELCVLTHYIQCQNQVNPVCLPYTSFLDEEDNFINELECRIENGFLMATWLPSNLIEIIYFNYNITRKNEFVYEVGTTPSKEIRQYVDEALSGAYEFSISPCAQCKCFQPLRKICIKSNHETNKNQARGSLWIPITVTVILFLFLIIGFLIFRKRQIANSNNNVVDMGTSNSEDTYEVLDTVEHPYEDITGLAARIDLVNGKTETGF